MDIFTLEEIASYLLKEKVLVDKISLLRTVLILHFLNANVSRFRALN